MSITPNGLAKSLRGAIMRRSLTDDPGEIKQSDAEASFLVYDNDGGILKVTVNQYKDPVR
jgi:hypothetical protein